MPEGESWTGVYFHPVYGYLHMVEEGSNVVGRWKRADQSKWGELSGTKGGNVLHYTWKEHTVGMIGASATTKGKGYFQYKMDKEDRPVLDGQFGLNDDETGSDWHNVKQARMQPGPEVDRRRLRRHQARRVLAAHPAFFSADIGAKNTANVGAVESSRAPRRLRSPPHRPEPRRAAARC